ncbi:MAG: alpha/beta hydrolase [Deltaproteobacteria bacterium]|nr:alpha/beta hydrolase [Deltaproteobacteria bacterium]
MTRPPHQGLSRREMLVGGAALAAAAWVPTSAVARTAPPRPRASEGTPGMTSIKTKDGTSIFYKDWGKGQPIVFSHGWPLSADAWDEQLLFFASHGYRAIAHDRRGHGRSGQPWTGNDMDTYADDLAALFEKLDLEDAVVIGHSSGGGEIARYLGRHGTRRVARGVLVSAITPLMLKTEANPGGVPLSAFDEVRVGIATNRSQYYRDASAPFFGANRPGAKVPRGVQQQFWLQSMQCGIAGAYQCVKAQSETDFTADLKRIAIPMLVIHSDDDQFVPFANHGPLTTKLLERGTLKVYNGAPHGLPMTHAAQFNADVLAFIRG